MAFQRSASLARISSSLLRWFKPVSVHAIAQLKAWRSESEAGRTGAVVRRRLRPVVLELEPRLQPNDVVGYLMNTSIFGSAAFLNASLSPAAIQRDGGWADAQISQPAGAARVSGLQQPGAGSAAFGQLASSPSYVTVGSDNRAGETSLAPSSPPAARDAFGRPDGATGAQQDSLTSDWFNAIESVFGASAVHGELGAAGAGSVRVVDQSGASAANISRFDLSVGKSMPVEGGVAGASPADALAHAASMNSVAPPKSTATGSGKAPATTASGNSPAAAAAAANAAISRLALAFEPNVGQSDPSVKFLAHGSGFSFYLTDSSAVFDLPITTGPNAGKGENVLRLDFQGASPAAVAVGAQQLSSHTNYLDASKSSASLSSIPNFSEAVIQNIYPGIDATFFGSNSGSVEYNFILHPGADASAIHLKWEGVSGLSTDAQGNINLQTGAGTIVQQAPAAFQAARGASQKSVPVTATPGANNTLTFRVGSYDKSRDLVIDPTVAFSTYLGGSPYEVANGAAVDSSTGDLLVDGTTTSGNFPTTSGVILSSWSSSLSNPAVMFLTKYASDGSSLVYSTYINAGNYECGANALAVDSSGNAYVAGLDVSETGTPTDYGSLLKINSTGTSILYSKLIASVYVGGPTNYVQGFTAVAVDSNGHAYVTGYSVSPIDNHSKYHYWSFALSYDSSGTQVYSAVLSTIYRVDDPMFGGRGIAVDGSGNAFVTGTGYNGTVGGSAVYELNSSGTVVQSAILTVTQPDTFADFDDGGYAIALDGSGNIYVTGLTNDAITRSGTHPYDFPVTSNALQSTASGDSACSAYLIELNSSFSVVYGSYLSTTGGNATGNTWGNGIAVDSQGNVTIVGDTSNTRFWIHNAPLSSQTTYPTGNNDDGFITQFSGSNLSTLVYSTYWGGPQSNDESGLSVEAATAVAVDSSRDVYVVGYTNSSSGFPITTGALQSTNPTGSSWAAYVSKLAPSS